MVVCLVAIVGSTLTLFFGGGGFLGLSFLIGGDPGKDGNLGKRLASEGEFGPWLLTNGLNRRFSSLSFCISGKYLLLVSSLSTLG